MKTIIDLNDVFKFLRKRAKADCSCGNRDFIGEIFHESGCPFVPISEKAFSEYYAGTFKLPDEPKKEINHAVTISKEETTEREEPASDKAVGAITDDFKLTPG